MSTWGPLMHFASKQVPVCLCRVKRTEIQDIKVCTYGILANNSETVPVEPNRNRCSPCIGYLKKSRVVEVNFAVIRCKSSTSARTLETSTNMSSRSVRPSLDSFTFLSFSMVYPLTPVIPSQALVCHGSRSLKLCNKNRSVLPIFKTSC